MLFTGGRLGVGLVLGIMISVDCGLNAAFADSLRIGGTGSATELMKRLGAAFERSEAGVTVEVIPGLGSSGSIAATADGALDIAISARPLKPAEADAGLTGSVFARTPYGMVSSNPSPGDIAPGEVAVFYGSIASRWPDGSKVRVILRPKSESDTTLLGQTFPGMAEAIDAVRTRIDVTVAATDQDNLDLAGNITGSLVGTSLAQIVTESRRLQFMTINGYAPTLENLEQGHYPYAKSFYMVVPAKPTPLSERFSGFIQSEAGKAILREAACLPVAQ